MTSAPITPEQAAYLLAHREAVLGTGRRDGSPQLSLVNYLFDGEACWVSVTSDRAKWVNALRQPRVSLLVADGGRQAIVYGTAEGITDRTVRNAMTRRLRATGQNPAPDDEEAFSRALDEQHRVLLKITPRQVIGSG